jgi:haloalkane dehalogenase
MTAPEPPSSSPPGGLSPFAPHWLDSPQGRVHYLDEGEGRPILMLHGNPTWSFLYRHLIADLRDEFRCVAPDLPGFGRSERPAGYGYTPAEHAAVVGELIERLDLRDLVLMAQDWGGPIGLSAAADHADRIGGLAIGNTWFWAPDLPMKAFSVVMSSPPLKRAVLRRNLFVERIIPRGTVRSLDASEMEQYRAVQPDAASRVGIAALLAEVRGSSDWLAALSETVPAKLGETPTLIIWGMKDSAFRDAEVLELPDAGHYFPEDAPEAVAAAVRRRFGPARTGQA